MNNYVELLLPGIIVAGTAVVVLFVDAFSRRKAPPRLGRLAGGLAVAAGVAAGQWLDLDRRLGRVALRSAGGAGRAHGPRSRPASTAWSPFDKYSLFFTVLFCVVGVLTVMLSDALPRAARDEARRVLRAAAVRRSPA